MDLTQYLSADFQLFELIRTGHTEIDNTPSQDVVDLLRLNAQTLWQKVRDKWGPQWVDNGYRCPELNAAVGGVTNPADPSAHIFGCAADLVPQVKGVTPTIIVAWLITSDLPFDQAIDETSKNGGRWLHLAGVRPGFHTVPRREALVTTDGKVYRPFPGGAK